jgi:hypothetical protein
MGTQCEKKNEIKDEGEDAGEEKSEIDKGLVFGNEASSSPKARSK